MPTYKMKFILLVSILFFWNAVEASTGNVVLDRAGKKLQPHVDYHILPVIRGRGGGLTLAARNGSCPFNVAQEKLEVSNGLPMTFLPVDSKDKVVTLSSDMNVVFSASTVCVQSTVWRLGDVDKVTGKRYVTTGGVTGNPGLSTVSNWFKIEKYNDDYKLVFCPSVCNFCKVICGDVGVLNEGGKRWLGLSDVPFPVMFKKA